MTNYEYRTSHPLGWTVVGIALVAAVAGLATVQGWLPGFGDREAAGTEITPESVAQVSYSYEITIRYEDGSIGVFNQAEPPQWQPGDKLRIVDGMHLIRS
ncbi:MAG: hypothetical protein ACT4UP_06465 [Gammaproteobacteria bacterium]